MSMEKRYFFKTTNKVYYILMLCDKTVVENATKTCKNKNSEDDLRRSISQDLTDPSQNKSRIQNLQEYYLTGSVAHKRFCENE